MSAGSIAADQEDCEEAHDDSLLRPDGNESSSPSILWAWILIAALFAGITLLVLRADGIPLLIGGVL